jgi:hypothetical protein
MQRLDAGAHRHAQRRVEIGERFVHQEHRRLAHHRAAQRDALTLPAGQLAGPPLEQVLDLERTGRRPYPRVDLVLRILAHAQPERDVLIDVLVGIKRIALEHHCDIALVGRHVVHLGVVETQAAFGNLFEAGDHVERRRLAAAGRPEQHQELLVPDSQVQVVQRYVPIGIAFRDLLKLDLRHVSIPLSLDRAGGQAGDDVALEHHGDDDGRYDRDDAGRVDE